jgi:uncharacterized membrane protein
MKKPKNNNTYSSNLNQTTSPQSQIQHPNPGSQQQAILMQQGPLPISKEFDGYEKVLPGSAARILAMAEKEQESRINIANQAIKLQNKQLDNTKSIEITKAWGDIIKKFTPIIGAAGICLVAIFSKESDWLPYVILFATILAPEAKNIFDKFFK